MIKILLLVVFTSTSIFAISLWTQKKHYGIGEPIHVKIVGMPGNDEDWLGIFYAYDDNAAHNIVYRVALNGKKEGMFSFPSLDEAHEYEVRAFIDGSFEEEAYYPFEVIQQAKTDSIVINEVMASNAHTLIDKDFSTFSDWIELYNGSDESIDLGGYKLSDKISKAKWSIPEGTVIPAKGYILFWADGKDVSLQEHHTNFKLKGKGEAVALFGPSGTLIDSIEFGRQHMDISAAKWGESVGYTYPTPLEKNWSLSAQLNISNIPTISHQGGFYDSPIRISLDSDHGSRIYYTTDGSYPTYGSTLYTEPFFIEKTTVVRAMSVKDEAFPSDRITHTFFINEATTLPAISIATDGAYFWDDMIGIYVEGKNGIPKVCGKGNANFMQDWKRPINIEYYDNNGLSGFSQEVHIKMSGQCSRSMAQKSFSIKADDIYGKSTVNYRLFQEKNIHEFKSFKLRNSGQDWWKTMFRDAMIQRLIKDDLDIDYQAYEPCVVYLNGTYWGLYNIREKKNEDFLANNYPDLDPNHVDILYGGKQIVKEGKVDDYAQLIAFIEEHDLSEDAYYQYVAEQIDIANYIDYQITQIFIANFDWPRNNIRYWKEQKKGAKWRWMMDDQDVGFHVYDEESSESSEDFGLFHNTLAFAIDDDSDDWRNRPWATFLLRNMFKNSTFIEHFVQRYHELLDTTFRSQNIVELIERMQSVIEPEMPRQIETWGDAGPDYSSMEQWYKNVEHMKNFAIKRPVIAKKHLTNMFE